MTFMENRLRFPSFSRFVAGPTEIIPMRIITNVQQEFRHILRRQTVVQIDGQMRYRLTILLAKGD
jgi:hypothetical protein